VAETDEEQIEEIKNWWSENGTSLMVSVVVVLAGVFGYQAWDNSVQETAEAASSLYEDLVTAVVQDSPLEVLDEDRLSTGRFLSSRLKEEYAGTSYAHMGALFMAKISVESDDLEAAQAELEWILDNGVEESLEVIVRLRLAQVLLAMDRADDAMASLDAVEAGSYLSSFEEMKGDIALARGNNDEAREAYRRAIDAMDEGTSKPFLQMKLDNLVVPVTSIPADDGEIDAETMAGGES
jgi:predicted negative regulator of RcsB-dependent stress response